MKLLLDTHIALWLIYKDYRLSKTAVALLTNPDNALFVSAASIWEIAIKYAVKRGDDDNAMPVSGKTAKIDLEGGGLIMLPITAAHAGMVDGLPRHHGDPFDRMLIAQALSEPLRLVTADKALAAYGEIVIVV
jgi:PIN domain nuclease of toxin-antitoxin system